MGLIIHSSLTPRTPRWLHLIPASCVLGEGVTEICSLVVKGNRILNRLTKLGVQGGDVTVAPSNVNHTNIG